MARRRKPGTPKANCLFLFGGGDYVPAPPRRVNAFVGGLGRGAMAGPGAARLAVFVAARGGGQALGRAGQGALIAGLGRGLGPALALQHRGLAHAQGEVRAEHFAQAALGAAFGLGQKGVAPLVAADGLPGAEGLAVAATLAPGRVEADLILGRGKSRPVPGKGRVFLALGHGPHLLGSAAARHGCSQGPAAGRRAWWEACK